MRLIDQLSAKKLRELYWQKKMSSPEVVKNNVLDRNKKYNNLQDTFWYKLYLKEGVKI